MIIELGQKVARLGQQCRRSIAVHKQREILWPHPGKEALKSPDLTEQRDYQAASLVQLTAHLGVLDEHLQRFAWLIQSSREVLCSV
jgi:hypothetical protein